MNAPLDIDRARFNMIEQQIRPWDVLDQDVLDLLGVVKREAFVPEAHKMHAFTDIEIPLMQSGGKTILMWSPKMEARVLQELQVKSSDRALEIGSGSGYFSALLAHCCHSVTSVEIVPELKALAERNLKAAQISNVRVMAGDGANGFGGEKFDVIVLTGSTPIVSKKLLDQLNPGGRLFAVTGDAPAMTARIFTSGPQGTTDEELFETVIAPLDNAPQPERFKF